MRARRRTSGGKCGERTPDGLRMGKMHALSFPAYQLPSSRHPYSAKRARGRNEAWARTGSAGCMQESWATTLRLARESARGEALRSVASRQAGGGERRRRKEQIAPAVPLTNKDRARGAALAMFDDFQTVSPYASLRCAAPRLHCKFSAVSHARCVPHSRALALLRPRALHSAAKDETTTFGITV